MSKVTYKGGNPVGPQRVKHKSTWWRYFLMWLTGVVSAFAITGIVIGILGVSFTVKDIANMSNSNLDGILQPGYQNYTALELVSTLASRKYETLGDIYQVTPLPKKLLDETINPLLKKELNFEYNWEELKTKPFQLPVQPRTGVDTEEAIDTYLGRAIKEGVTIASFINQESHPALLNLFLYPKDENGEYLFDQPYTLADYINADDEFFNRIIDSIRIKDVVTIDPDDRIMSEIGDWSIAQLTQDNIDELSLGLFLPQSDNPLITTLSSWKIKDLYSESSFKNLKLSDLIEVNSTTPKLIITLMELEYTIGQLESTNLYYVLKVEDVFDISGNNFLEALKSYYLYQLEDSDTIMNIKLGEVFSDTSIAHIFGDSTLHDVTQDGWFSGLKLIDIFSEEDRTNNPIIDALITKDEDITFGDLSDPNTIQSLTISDVLDSSTISDNLVLSALSDSPINELGNAINELTIADILPSEDIANNSILTALQDAPLIDIGGAIDELALLDALGIDLTNPDTPLILKTISSWKIKELDEKLPNLTLGNVMDFTNYPDLADLADAKISNIDSVIDTIKTKLKLKDVVEIDENSPKILYELRNTKLVDLADTVQTLTLGQLIDCTTHPLLGALSSVAILDGDAVLEKINNLKLNQIYTASQVTGVMEIIWDKYNGGDISITDLPTAMSNLTLVELLADNLYDNSEPTKTIGSTTYKRINTMWWLLLTESDEVFTDDEMYYVLKKGNDYNINNGLAKCVTNFEYHMSHDCIRTLYRAKFINIDSAYVGKLETTIFYDGSFVKVGDLTIDQLANFSLSLIP